MNESLTNRMLTENNEYNVKFRIETKSSRKLQCNKNIERFHSAKYAFYVKISHKQLL